MGKALTPERLKQFLDDVASKIEKRGHVVQGVFNDDEPASSFAYTIGLSKTTGHELIILGLPVQTAGSILNAAADEIKGLSAPLTEDYAFSNIANFPFHVRFISAESAKARCVVMRYFINFESTKFVQLVWPDRTGKFPGTEGCSELTVTSQLF